jgi:hypothetical protein
MEVVAKGGGKIFSIKVKGTKNNMLQHLGGHI